jgi:acetolactate synthase-1/2/3 large subunit
LTAQVACDAEEHPLSLGVFGYGGSRWALDAVRDDEVEVLVVIGSGLSQRDTMQWDPAMLPSRALVHVETDRMLIGRTWPREVPLLGDPATVLERLAGLRDDDAAGLEAGREARPAFLAARPWSGLRPHVHQPWGGLRRRCTGRAVALPRGTARRRP